MLRKYLQTEVLECQNLSLQKAPKGPQPSGLQAQHGARPPPLRVKVSSQGAETGLAERLFF